MAGLRKAERGDYDVVIISRGGAGKEEGYGILDDDDVKTFVANMTVNDNAKVYQQIIQ